VRAAETPLDDYLEGLSSPADELLVAIERWANLHTAQPQMVCGPHEGALLTALCRSLSARTVVEVGSFVGYSTICLARGMSAGATLHAFEVNEEYEAPLRRHIAMAGVDDRVLIHMGDAKVLLPEVLEETALVDMAFIDADKRNLSLYYEMIIPRMRRGGLVLIDNVLWGGKVLDTVSNHDADTLAMDAFNKMVCNDPRVENVMLNVRDGLTVCSVL